TTERWVNDPSTHREKPDLVGPSIGSFPLNQSSTHPASQQFPYQAYRSDLVGTSFSTPFVTGTAALLMATFPDPLTNDPTLTRAVLMASARHGFPGLPPVPLFSDGVDDKAGVGAPRGDRAHAILEDGNFFSKFVDRATDFDSSGDLTAPVEFSVNAGDRVRV